jgi:hypothetical protein
VGVLLRFAACSDLDRIVPLRPSSGPDPPGRMVSPAVPLAAHLVVPRVELCGLSIPVAVGSVDRAHPQRAGLRPLRGRLDVAGPAPRPPNKTSSVFACGGPQFQLPAQRRCVPTVHVVLSDGDESSVRPRGKEMLLHPTVGALARPAAWNAGWQTEPPFSLLNALLDLASHDWQMTNAPGESLFPLIALTLR